MHLLDSSPLFPRLATFQPFLRDGGNFFRRERPIEVAFDKATSAKTFCLYYRWPRVSTSLFLFQLQYFDFLFGEVKRFTPEPNIYYPWLRLRSEEPLRVEEFESWTDGLDNKESQHEDLFDPRIIYTRFRTKLAVLLRRIKNQNIEAEIKTWW